MRNEEKARIASRFKALREHLLLSQADLGKYIGISRQEVNKIEAGRVKPQYRTLRHLEVFEARFRLDPRNYTKLTPTETFPRL